MFDYKRLEQIKDPIIRKAVEAAVRQKFDDRLYQLCLSRSVQRYC